MCNLARLNEFKHKQINLEEYLDSDEILELTDKELILLGNMNECLVAYCEILEGKVEAERSIIKLSDNSHLN